MNTVDLLTRALELTETFATDGQRRAMFARMGKGGRLGAKTAVKRKMPLVKPGVRRSGSSFKSASKKVSHPKSLSLHQDSHEARKATQKAIASGKREDHEKAEWHHDRLARAYQASGAPNLARYHIDMADAHGDVLYNAAYSGSYKSSARDFDSAYSSWLPDLKGK